MIYGLESQVVIKFTTYPYLSRVDRAFQRCTLIMFKGGPIDRSPPQTLRTHILALVDHLCEKRKHDEDLHRFSRDKPSWTKHHE